MTKPTCSSWRTSASGEPATAIRSAVCPGVSVPMSSRPSRSAADTVAARIPQPVPFGGRPEVVVGPVHRVCGHPPRRHARRHRPADHPPRERDLGGEPGPLRDAGRLAPLAVGRPLLRQGQRPVDERPPLRGRVPEERPDLGVLDAAGGVRVLAGHPARLHALLQEPRLVHHQHPARLTQVFGRVTPSGRRAPCRRPSRRGPGGAARRRGWGSQAFGELPAVLALGVAKQGGDVAHRSPPRLAAAEAGRDPLGHRLQLTRPPRHRSLRRSS